MKVLFFCSSKFCAQMVFELIRRRIFGGIVIPKTNTELIQDIVESGYIEEDKIFTPLLANDDELIKIIKYSKPDLCLVAAFPKIFKKQLLEMPSMGFYNFHFGFLPEYRGADPVFWQIKQAKKTAGICVHQMTEIIDGGGILYQDEVPIHYADTYASLFHKMTSISTSKLKEILDLIKLDHNGLKAQNQKESKYYPKPGFKDVSIDWQHMEVTEIIATIHACNPWNKGAITALNGEEIRILQATPADYDKELPDQPGLVFYADEKQGAFVICKNQKLLRIDAIYSSLGFAFGGRMLDIGITKGKMFKN